MSTRTIDEHTLTTLANNPSAVASFPELAVIRDTTATCCRRGQRQVVMNSIKTAMAGLSDERQGILKQLLGATRIRIYVRRGSSVKPVEF